MRIFIKLSSHGQPLCYLESLPLQIHFRFGNTDWHGKCIFKKDKFCWTKRMHIFPEFISFGAKTLKFAFAINLPNHVGDGIIFRQIRFTSNIPSVWRIARCAPTPPRQRRNTTRKCLEMIFLSKIIIFEFQRKCDFSISFLHVSNRRAAKNLGRCKFIFRFDHADRERQLNSLANNLIGPNEFADF